jgi:hypothetical protein
MAYFPFFKQGLRVPMQALVDYCGYRVIGIYPPSISLLVSVLIVLFLLCCVAMPVLPLRPDAPPVYGSNDAGKTIYAEDPKFNELMKKVGSHLHLCSHNVGGKELYSMQMIPIQLRVYSYHFMYL